MRFTDYLWPAGIIAELSATEKQAVLAELASPVLARNPALAGDEVLRVLQDREMLGSTAVGHGIAIPHGKLRGLDRMLLTFGRSGAGIAFDAPDGGNCHLFFMVLAPESAAGQHLGLLGLIARLGRDSDFRACIMRAANRAELWDIFSAV